MSEYVQPEKVVMYKKADGTYTENHEEAVTFNRRHHVQSAVRREFERSSNASLVLTDVLTNMERAIALHAALTKMIATKKRMANEAIAKIAKASAQP